MISRLGFACTLFGHAQSITTAVHGSNAAPGSAIDVSGLTEDNVEKLKAKYEKQNFQVLRVPNPTDILSSGNDAASFDLDTAHDQELQEILSDFNQEQLELFKEFAKLHPQKGETPIFFLDGWLPTPSRKNIKSFESLATPEEKPGKPFKIVLTGGPGGGKSTTVNELAEKFRAKGYNVLILPENATQFLANSEGFRGEWVKSDMNKDGSTNLLGERIKMQEIFIKYQLLQEKLFEKYAEKSKKEVIMILDRSIFDTKLFLRPEVAAGQWNELKKRFAESKYGAVLDDEHLKNRYDAVIHMQSSAVLEGVYKNCKDPDCNNKARYHTAEEARAADKQCEEEYKNLFGDEVQHKFYKARCQKDVTAKVQGVVNFIFDEVLQTEDIEHGYPFKKIGSDISDSTTSTSSVGTGSPSGSPIPEHTKGLYFHDKFGSDITGSTADISSVGTGSRSPTSEDMKGLRSDQNPVSSPVSILQDPFAFVH